MAAAEDAAVFRVLEKSKERFTSESRFNEVSSHTQCRLRCAAMRARQMVEVRSVHDLAYCLLLEEVSMTGEPAIVEWTEDGTTSCFSFGLSLVFCPELSFRFPSGHRDRRTLFDVFVKLAVSAPFAAMRRYQNEKVCLSMTTGRLCHFRRVRAPRLIDKLCYFVGETQTLRLTAMDSGEAPPAPVHKFRNTKPHSCRAAGARAS